MDVKISSEMEKVLQELASRNGQDVAEYAGALIEKQVQSQLRLSNGDDKDEDDPNALSRILAKMTGRSPAEIAEAQAHAVATCKPRNEIPPGQTLFDVVAGKWPGDETDAEVADALERLS